MRPNSLKSFTLVELLIVIAILAVLAAAVVVVLNPAELLAQARDSQRVTDMRTLKDAIDLFMLDNPSVSLGSSQTIYISLPDTSSTCATYTSLPILAPGWSYRCVTVANLRNTDGTGWIPLNIGSIKGGSPIPSLPIDPQNDQNLTKYYQYIPGTSYVYQLSSLLESEKQTKTANNDGGGDPGRLEVGSDMSLWLTASGLKGYWDFSEGSGTTTADLSGNGNTGTLVNSPTWVTGKTNSALSFDGVDDYVDIGTYSLTQFTFSLWVQRLGSYSGWRTFIGSSGVGGYEFNLDSSEVGKVNAYSHSQLKSTHTLGTGAWYHVTLVRDASGTKIYINGISSNSNAVTPSISGLPLAIGRWNLSQYLANTIIDEVRIYNRALSASEVRSIYNAGK